MQKDLTTGPIPPLLIGFALPYLASCFMQTLYGMVDLAIVGLFNTPTATSAVAIGSQIMHMITVITLGLVMGTTVIVAQKTGAKNSPATRQVIGTSIVFFVLFSCVFAFALILLKNQIVSLMLTPSAAIKETKQYLFVCFLGVPFIFCYNVISAVFRGQGNSKLPMVFVFISCVLNIALDFVFVGGLHWGALGAAFATVCGQAVCSILAMAALIKGKNKVALYKKDFMIHRPFLFEVLKVGLPISMQDGLIQVSFIIITIIANSRGLVASCAVGIVEKLICFMFLVPSAFLSSISGITAQNIGAKKNDRAKKALFIGVAICVLWGCFCVVISSLFCKSMIALFTKDKEVIKAGCQYLHSYCFDVLLAGVHFCFSGYFCGASHSLVSFVHNITAIVTFRVPGVWLATKLFPDTLFYMGLAAPLGSSVSSVICVCYFLYKNYYAPIPPSTPIT